jgi:hypothetical protein
MSPWEFKVGQLVGYKPRGQKWRARVTAVERDGKCHLAEIPVVDEQGEPIRYDDPPAFVNDIVDYENYFLVQNVDGKGTDPWIAARLDHEDTGLAWRTFAERIGVKEPYYQALATLMEKWSPEGQRGEFLDDLLVLLHAAWRAGTSTENSECARLLEKKCNERGIICLAHCTHSDDAQAIRRRIREQF